MKQFIVVAYDISNDKRRLKIAEALKGYGERINFSVFECYIKPAQIARLKKELGGLMKKEKDTIVFYYLCNQCLDKRELMGKTPGTADNDIVKTV